MTVSSTPLEGLVVLKPQTIGDPRGYFLERFRLEHMLELGLESPFVQDNESRSNAGVLRGLHLQAPPHAQAKLVHVVCGAIFDVAVDIRTGSPTYGRWFGTELNEDNKWSMLVPAGFAHGFCALSDNTVVQYKCSAYYNKESEMGIAWNDPDIGINWPLRDPLLSERDRLWPPFSTFRSPF